MKNNLKTHLAFPIKKIARLCLLMGVVGMMGYSAMAMEDIDENRPNEHLCPITHEVMKDPVVAADGHSYERTAISQHFDMNSNNMNSPITQLPLKNRDLIDNFALKTMIQEWKPGKQSEPSVLETRKAEDIAQRVREEFAKNAILLNAAKGQHIVAFLGNTGAGKSTLINFLAGKELVVSSDGEDYLLAHPEDKTAMVIGTGGDSETLYPKAIEVDGLRFFDLPGFNDTDGSERNLVNAAFTRKILLDAASVRLVFVVGQDQFTADRGASIKQMFNSISQLFVADGNVNLINDGLFVTTKMTWNGKTDLIDFLLKKADSRNNTTLSQQLQSWSQNNRLCSMFHPTQKESNQGARSQIRRLIQETKPVKILGLNVSVLYPPDTKGPLERMFFDVIERTFNRRLNAPLTTLSDYDKAITSYSSNDFWKTFDEEFSREDDAMGLLKEFCINPYNSAFKKHEKEKEGQRQAHVQGLQQKKQMRVKDIEKKTEARVKEVISAVVPKKEGDEFVAFDFAYHKDFYDQVCDPTSIQKLATDTLEQEVVRRSYTGFVVQHSHEQMMRWYQKFSGMEGLKKQLQATQAESLATKQALQAMNQRLLVLEVPLIKARQAEEEARRYQAQRAAEAEATKKKQAACNHQYTTLLPRPSSTACILCGITDKERYGY